MFGLVDKDVHAEHRDAVSSYSLEQLTAEADTLRGKLREAAREAGPDYIISQVKSLGGTNEKEIMEAWAKSHAQLAAVQDTLNDRQKLATAKDAIERSNTGGGTPAGDEDTELRDRVSSLENRFTPSGDVIRPSDLLQQAIEARGGKFESGKIGDFLQNNPGVSFDIDTDLSRAHRAAFGRPDIHNATFKTSAGVDPFIQREAGITDSSQRPPQILDLIPTVMLATGDGVKYMRESTYTSGAAEVAEEGDSPDSALAATEKTEHVRRITTKLPVTEEQMEDVPMVRDYVDRRLVNMMMARLDQQILVGNGTAPNLSGLHDTSNDGRPSTRLQDLSIKSNKWDASKVYAELFAAQDGLRNVAYAEPTAYILMHKIWEGMSLRETSSAGFYFGSPQDQFSYRIWGKPVAISNVYSPRAGSGASTNQAVGMVGDFTGHTCLRLRHGLRMEVGLNADDFAKHRYTIRASIRAALCVYNEAALCRIELGDYTNTGGPF